MNAVCFYFQVHQPFRLSKNFDFFSIGSSDHYEDDATNAQIARKVADRCYLPTNQLILELIEKHQGKFRVSYSISGTALDQFELYTPEVIESFKKLSATGCVEFLSETYYHSLASLFSEKEFKVQVQLHQQKIKSLFGQESKTFRNTELIYNNYIANMAQELGFKTILAEGADRILGWKSPNFVYHPPQNPNMSLLLKNYRLSDDIAFRFSDRQWKEWPLTAEKFSGWVHQVAGQGDVVNLFMDYETFGEHQWKETGIFEFLRHLPEKILSHPDFAFLTPSEVTQSFKPVAELDIPDLVSWADIERDVSAWLGNPLQDSAAKYIFGLEEKVLATQDEKLIHAWRKLQTSDHFYYMCIKWYNDGDVHKYFNPYESPYDAFIHYQNAVHQVRWYAEELANQQAQQLSQKTKLEPMTKVKSISKAKEKVTTKVKLKSSEKMAEKTEEKSLQASPKKNKFAKKTTFKRDRTEPINVIETFLSPHIS